MPEPIFHAMQKLYPKHTRHSRHGVASTRGDNLRAFVVVTCRCGQAFRVSHEEICNLKPRRERPRSALIWAYRRTAHVDPMPSLLISEDKMKWVYVCENCHYVGETLDHDCPGHAIFPNEGIQGFQMMSNWGLSIHEDGFEEYTKLSYTRYSIGCKKGNDGNP